MKARMNYEEKKRLLLDYICALLTPTDAMETIQEIEFALCCLPESKRAGLIDRLLTTVKAFAGVRNGYKN